jgi:amino acid transporter
MIVYGFSTSPATFDFALAHHLHKSAESIMAVAPVKRTSLGVAFGSALPVLFFGYLGLSTATQTGGEARNAKHSLARGVLIAVSLVTVIYTLFAAAIYHAVPWQVIAGLAKLKMSAYTTSSGLLQFVMPQWLASLINLLVALIVMKTLLPIFLAQSRWVYAWSEDGLIPPFFARTHAKFKTPVLALTLSALFGSISLVESIQLGYVFGVNVRVLSVMIVFFFMGLGMLMFPKHAPELYAANQSSLATNRLLQVTVGVFLMLVSVWFSVSITLSSLKSPFFLQPVVQTVIVALIGVLIYWRYLTTLKRPGLDPAVISASRERFKHAPLQ